MTVPITQLSLWIDELKRQSCYISLYKRSPHAISISTNAQISFNNNILLNMQIPHTLNIGFL